MDPELIAETLEALREGKLKIKDIPPSLLPYLGLEDKKTPGWGERLNPLSDYNRGVYEQFGAGVGEVLPTAALGLAETFEALGIDEQGGGSDKLRGAIARRREESAPDRMGEGSARFLGRMLGEGALGVAAGAPLRGVGIAGRVFNARGAGVLGDILTGTTIAQAGAEESTLGGLSALLPGDNNTLNALAENPWTRALGEIGMSLGGDVAFNALGNVYRGARETNPRPPDLREQTVSNYNRREKIDAIDRELNEISQSSELVSAEGVDYNTELSKIRAGEPTESMKTKPLAPEVAERWRALTLERQALIEDAVPEALNIKGMDPEAELHAKAAWAADSDARTMDAEAAKLRARKAFGDKLRWDKIKKHERPWDKVIKTYMNYVDVDKPSEWLAEGLDLAGIMEDPAKLARLKRRTQGAFVQIWQKGLKTIGDDEAALRTMGPQQMIDDLAGGDAESLGYAMAAKREEELRGRGDLGKRLTDEQLAAGLEIYNSNAGIRQAVDGFKKYAEEWLNTLEEEAIIPLGNAEKIRAEGNYWFAPFEPASNDKMVQRLFGGKTASFKDPLQRLGFSHEEVPYMNPVLSWIDYTARMTEQVARKRVHTAVANIGDLSAEGIVGDNADVVRGAGLIKKIEKKDIPSGARKVTGGADDLIAAMGVEEIDELLQTNDGAYYFRYRDINGETHHYKVNKHVYEWLREVEPTQISDNPLVQTLIAPGKALRKGVTITPAFMGANTWRDSAFRGMSDPSVRSSVPFVGFVRSFSGALNASEELLRDAMHKAGISHYAEDPNFRAFDFAGGTQTTIFDMDANEIRRVVAETREGLPQWYRGWNRVKAVGRKANHGIKTVGSISENSNRLDTFKRVKQEMLSKGYSTLEANLEAAYQAGESTVDFSRRGRKFEESQFVKTLDRASAFWRASIQGTDRMVRQFGDITPSGFKLNPDAIKQTTVAGASLFAAAAANYAFNRTNPDYYDTSKDTRSRYVLFDIGRVGGILEAQLQDLTGVNMGPQATEDQDKPILKQGQSLFLKVPVPHEFGWLFATGPIRMIEELDDANPYSDRTNPIIKAFAAGADPIGQSLTQLVGPINPLSSSFGGAGVSTAIGLATNRDRFRDMDIVPAWQKDLNPDLQGRGTESGGAKLLSETFASLGLNTAAPGQIDFLARGVGGGTGGAIMDALGGLREGGEATGLTSKGPLRRFFVDPSRPSGAMEAFYNEYFKLKAKQENSKQYEERGMPTRAGRELSKMTEEDTIRFTLMETLYPVLQDLNTLQQYIESNPSISGEQKHTINEAIREEAALLLKGGSYRDPEDMRALIERDSDPERNAIVTELYESWKAEKKKITSIRRRI